MKVIQKPLITEKANQAAEDRNCFTFVVDKKANKLQIKAAIEEMYGVNVESVRTMVMPGKKKVKYTKKGMVEGGTGSYKKAIVQVRSGETIDLYNNI